MVLEIEGNFLTAAELDDALADGALTQEEVLDAVTYEIHLLHDVKLDIESEIAHLQAQLAQMALDRKEAIRYYQHLTGDTESMW